MPKKKVKSFGISQGLQASLEETITTAQEYSGELNIQAIPLSKIILDPDNPRDLLLTVENVINGISKTDPDLKRKQEEIKKLSLLADTIKHQGLINPILVYKSGNEYRLVAGERRTLASHLVGSKSIQAKILDAEPSPLKASLLQWVENIHREDLTLWERIHNVRQIVEAYLTSKGLVISELTAEVLAGLIGISLSQAAQYNTILKSSQQIQINIKNGSLQNLDKASFIANMPEAYQESLIDAVRSGITLKQLKVLAEHQKATPSTPKKESRGRQATKIQLGVTKKVRTAKQVMNILLASEELINVQPLFSSLDWNDISSINASFKKLIGIIEDMD